MRGIGRSTICPQEEPEGIAWTLLQSAARARQALARATTCPTHDPLELSGRTGRAPCPAAA